MTTKDTERPVLSYRAAVRTAAFTRKAPARYLAIPRTAWLGHQSAGASPVDDPGISEEPVDPDLPPLGRAAVTRLGGAAAMLLYGVPTGVLVGTPAGLAIGAAAGVFGWLAGRSLADDYYVRHHGDDVSSRPGGTTT